LGEQLLASEEWPCSVELVKLKIQFIPHRNTLRIHYKGQPVNAAREMICLLRGSYETRKTPCEQNSEFVNVKADGAYSKGIVL
jgi:hypothetical protein